MKKLMIAACLMIGSVIATEQLCDSDQPTSFEQAIANAKKAKQITLIMGIRLKGDETTPQEQFDAVIDKIASCLSEESIKALMASCPFFTELNTIQGLTGSFFIQASDGSGYDDDTINDTVNADPSVEEQATSEVAIEAPCTCE